MTNLGPQFRKEIKRNGPNDFSQEFSISRLNFGRHIFVVVLTVLLCFSLFMSELSRFNQSHHLDFISKLTPIYILLIGFSLLIAIKAIVSVRQIKVNNKGLEISNLFWRENLSWTELKALQAPKNLRFAWLRTKRSFYLFIKAEFENYAELEALIGQYLAIES